MDDITEIKESLKDIQSELRAISDTLVRNTMSLEVHEARTDASEKRIEKIENGITWTLGLFVAGFIAYLMKAVLKS